MRRGVHSAEHECVNHSDADLWVQVFETEKIEVTMDLKIFWKKTLL